MFPSGWPGKGLLVLRLACGIILLHDGIYGLVGAPHREPLALLLFAAGGGAFLLAGLWTPVAGILTAVVELCIVVTGADHSRSAILLMAMGFALAMLGPGGWSIDALLFGRQRLEIRIR